MESPKGDFRGNLSVVALEIFFFKFGGPLHMKRVILLLVLEERKMEKEGREKREHWLIPSIQVLTRANQLQ
jgi:hypothetical protein